MAMKTKVALCVAIILGTVSSALAASPPQGTPASSSNAWQTWKHLSMGAVWLGSRDTPEYIQDRGNLDSME